MYGSANSHTAILARTMNIPAVIGLGETLSSQYDGKMAVIDGFTGILYVDPDEETLARMQEKRAKDLEQKELLNQLKGKENDDQERSEDQCLCEHWKCFRPWSST